MREDTLLKVLTLFQSFASFSPFYCCHKGLNLYTKELESRKMIDIWYGEKESNPMSNKVWICWTGHAEIRHSFAWRKTIGISNHEPHFAKQLLVK